MATGSDKFLNYNGLVKLIGLIKKRINDAVSWKTNTFVKSIAGYGTGTAPASTSGVNDTKNKLEGTYTTGNLDGTGTDVATNKFTYIDTTYGGASTSKAGLMAAADKAKLDNLGSTGALKGANLVTYDSSAAATEGSVAAAIKGLQGTVSGAGLVKSVDNAEQDAATSTAVNIKPNHARTGKYTKADGTGGTFTYYDTRYGNATAESKNGNLTVAGQDGLMSTEDKTKLDSLGEAAATGKGSTLVGYGKSIGGENRATVTAALDALNTALANAGNVDDVKVNGNSVLSGKNALIVIKENGTQVIPGNDNSIDIECATGFSMAGSLQAFPANQGILEIPAVANQEYAGDTADSSGVLTSAQYGGILARLGEVEDDAAARVSGVTVNGSSVVNASKVAVISAVTGIKNNGEANYTTGEVTIKKINNNSLVGTGSVTINSGIGLSTNITVDGVSKSTVQDALVALNVLAAANKTAISNLTTAGLTREIVTELPTGSDIKANVIYLILASNDTMNSGDPSTSATTTPYSSNSNSYNEYMYINSAWERIGSTEVNLDIDAITNDEIDTAWSTTSAAA